MERSKRLSLIKYPVGFLLAGLLAALSAICLSDVIASLAEDDLKPATSCSFVVTNEFVPGTEKGVFINRNYPMESSSIKYSYYDNEKDRILTNREKARVLASGETKIIDESLNLTKEIYQETMSAAYDNEYQQKVDFKVSSFEKIKIDGYPGFKITSSYKVSDEEKIHQTVYMLISKYRLFTITYQRAEDDECQDLFDESAATIHVS